MSPGLRAMSDKAAAAVPFAQAAGLLEDLAGVRLTVKRVERAAEASGTALAAASRARAGLIAGRKLVPLPPSPLPGKLCIVIDGTGVPVTAKETAGRDGKSEDGRARTREVKMGVFFSQDKVTGEGYPVRDRTSSSYIATFEPAAAFGRLVKAEGIRRGADPACATAGSAHAACSPALVSSRQDASPSSASASNRQAGTGPSTAPVLSRPCAASRPAAPKTVSGMGAARPESGHVSAYRARTYIEHLTGCKGLFRVLTWRCG